MLLTDLLLIYNMLRIIGWLILPFIHKIPTEYWLPVSHSVSRSIWLWLAKWFSGDVVVGENLLPFLVLYLVCVRRRRSSLTAIETLHQEVEEMLCKLPGTDKTRELKSRGVGNCGQLSGGLWTWTGTGNKHEFQLLGSITAFVCFVCFGDKGVCST